MPQDIPSVLPRVISLLHAPSYWPSASPGVCEALERLTARSEMYPVWEGISRYPDPPYLPELFLDACLIALVQWPSLSKNPSLTLSADLSQIAAAARRLAKLLRSHDAD